MLFSTTLNARWCPRHIAHRASSCRIQPLISPLRIASRRLPSPVQRFPCVYTFAAPQDRSGDPASDSNLPADEEEEGIVYEGEVEDEEDEVFEEDEAPGRSDIENSAYPYPEPPGRSYYLPDFLAESSYVGLARESDELYHDFIINGLQNTVDKVDKGDIFFAYNRPGYDGKTKVVEALQAGAGAVFMEGVPEDLPEDMDPPEKIKDAFVVPIPDAEALRQVQVRMAHTFYDHPAEAMTTVGVIGSAGKTTVAWMVRGILEQRGDLTGMVGSLEHAIAEDRLDEDGEIWQPTEEDTTADRDYSSPFHLSEWQGKYEVKEDTPDPLHMTKLLAGMRDRGAQSAVVECAPGYISLGHIDGLSFDVVVVNNLIKPMGLGDDEAAYQADKAAVLALLESLGQTDEDEETDEQTDGQTDEQTDERADKPTDRPTDEQTDEQTDRPTDEQTDEQMDEQTDKYTGKQTVVVINLDDPAAEELLAATNVPVVTFSLTNTAADVHAQTLTTDLRETEMIVRTPVGRVQIITPIMGQHNAANVLAAVAVGIALEVPLEFINAGIEEVEVVPGRCEPIDEGQNFTVLVDAASTPETLQALLTSVREARPTGRVFLLMGSDGDVPMEVRLQLGEVANSLADIIMLTNASPMLDQPNNIIQDIVAGFSEEVLKHGEGLPYWFLQDNNRAPMWFEPYLQYLQRHVRRYVMEDRAIAIRSTIGTAQEGDVVILAGRGAQDYVEHWDGQGGIMRGWFDDRVEARYALSQLGLLASLHNLIGQRAVLPWDNTLDQAFADPPRGIVTGEL